MNHDPITQRLEQMTPVKLKKLSVEELTELSADIRQFLIASTAATGGHIGANLGVVELSLALHYVLSSPEDNIIWDTGHQGYVHKIITGRANLFPTLNTYGGMNRFVTRQESEHDLIEASHAGTSISIALGIALARRLKGDTAVTVAVIGDGALCEGMAWEALNHAAVEKGIKLMLVLNDNGFSISPGFGALHQYLQGRTAEEPETLFTSLGYEYIGPVDGHSMSALLEAFARAKKATKIPFVHIKTVKGRGLPPAAAHPYRLHFSAPFDPATGVPKDTAPVVAYQDIAARVLTQEMEKEKNIVCITPSTLYATGLQQTFEKFSDRCFDPGMEEQHAMTMTVGFALQGYKPVIFYQSTFMQRAFDQLVHDVCFMNLPTLLLTVRTGFAGYDNPTHHGIYDFSYMRGLPNLTVLYPKDQFELERMVKDNLRALTGPTLISMPYGPVDAFDESVLTEDAASFAQPQVVEEGEDLTIITVGHLFGIARETVERLRQNGIRAGLINLRQVKPLPEQALIKHMSRSTRVVTLEEGVLDGGVGSAIAALASDHRLSCEILRIGVPNTFVEPGSFKELRAAYGLDADGVLAKIKEYWKLPV